MKTLLVTGASSGIGKAVAIFFASKGYAVSITARSEEGLQKTKGACIAAGCPENKVLITAGDLTNRETAVNVVEDTIKNFGSIDVLVNNAGFAIIGLFENTTMEDYDRQMDLNLRSVHQLTQLAIPHLLKVKGSIVNISSFLSSVAWPMSGFYCVSKAALDMYTKGLALELASRGVRVNSVNPGLVDTEFQSRCGICTEENKHEAMSEFAKSHPIGRGAQPEEIAKAVFFLASAENEFMTGSIVIVDGGRSIGQAFDPTATLAPLR